MVYFTCDDCAVEEARVPAAGGAIVRPKFPELDDSKAIQVPGPVFAQMIERVTFAITTEDPRYSLNGALCKIEEGALTLVATDGHRLAYITRDLGLTPPDGNFSVIVPKKALTEILKLSSDLGAEDTVSFGKAGKQVFFHVAGHRLTSTLLEGNFPRYENVMPGECATHVIVPTEDLSQAVRRVSLLASDRFGRAVKLELSNGKLELSSETEVGEAHESLHVDYEGDSMTIGFNARYLLDYLAVVGSPSVRLELNPAADGQKPNAAQAGDRPGQFRPDPADESDYRYIVMPMHL